MFYKLNKCRISIHFNNHPYPSLSMSVRRTCLSLFFFLLSYVSFAQSLDTLDASRVTSAKTRMPETLSSVNISVLGHVMSPEGDSDLLKRVQMVSGVSTGAEGTSAYYVRGGNMGSNVVLLDGARLYGTGHLLGLTSSFPSDIVSSADFKKGGFDGWHYNQTASCLDLKTREASYSEFSEYVSISNFLVGAGVSGPVVKDKASIMVSIRYSPAEKEYGIVRNAAGHFGFELPDRVDMSVYDLYAKATVRHAAGAKSSLSIFNSHDSYSYGLEENDRDGLGWDNHAINYTHERDINDTWHFSGNASLSRYANHQNQYRVLSGVENNLGVGSRLTDCSVAGKFIRPGAISRTMGINLDYTAYLPGLYNDGSISKKADRDRTFLTSLWYQVEKARAHDYSFKAMFRGNIYAPVREYDEHVTLHPEASLSWMQFISGDFGYEISADYLAQFYHLLEGLPVGWSADMIVPANKINAPESSWQGTASLFYRGHALDVEVGPYYKHFDGLVYFPDATKLFSPVLGGWKQSTYSGTGLSYGLESSMDLKMERLDAHVSYTWSKTTRHFDEVNGGETFRAKFDRPHMLNSHVAYSFCKSDMVTHGLSMSFVLQSGHLESLKYGTYELDFLKYEKVESDYFGKENNYRMPTYIRLDSGYFWEFAKGRFHHKLDLGVYNVLNRHNPLCLYYDTDSESWKQLSLFPVMPSLSYKLSF